ncbi:MAG: DUF2282 domain-containing protein [Gammaproteobacteria bacterium]|nr:DUF2282 domain-containing protein [Gammaproteobacteria bacterium]
MRKTDALIAGAIAGVLSLAISLPSLADEAKPEKCYSIAKAGKNDCQTASSACAGTTKKDGQKDAWLYMPKGTCEKIVGASLTPMKS